jgi:hypothetical protein
MIAIGAADQTLADRPSRPDRVWNRIPEAIRSQIVDLVLDQPELSPRELAVRFTDEAEYFVSEHHQPGLHCHQSGRGIQGQDHGRRATLEQIGDSERKDHASRVKFPVRRHR